MTLKWDDKDPNEVDSFQIDWSERLTSETISSSDWTIEPDDDELAEDSSSHTTTMTTIWLSGGVEATTYEVTNRVVTTAGRTFDQTVKLKVKSQ